jgi:predicted  nucleic acid-binding Zn-ribbon protein
MTQQISIEDALTAFREQHGKLADENVLLRAQVTRLERELADARAQVAPEPEAPAGPDLAAQPRYQPAGDRD